MILFIAFPWRLLVITRNLIYFILIIYGTGRTFAACYVILRQSYTHLIHIIRIRCIFSIQFIYYLFNRYKRYSYDLSIIYLSIVRWLYFDLFFPLSLFYLLDLKFIVVILSFLSIYVIYPYKLVYFPYLGIDLNQLRIFSFLSQSCALFYLTFFYQLVYIINKMDLFYPCYPFPSPQIFYKNMRNDVKNWGHLNKYYKIFTSKMKSTL